MLIIKPPLGIMPKYIYEIKRIQDIVRALNDYTQYDVIDNIDIMIEWSKELTERLENLK
jgi:hypothetical protein